MENDLSKEELIKILKAITAWNQGRVEFHKGYLEYADQYKMYVSRSKDTISVTVKLPGQQ